MVILVAVDGETTPDRKVQIGKKLALAHDEQLLVLYVMPQETFDQRHHASLDNESDSEVFQTIGSLSPGESKRQQESSSRPPYTIEDAQRDSRSVAETITKSTLEETENISYQGRIGDPTEEIIEASRQQDACRVSSI